MIPQPRVDVGVEDENIDVNYELTYMILLCPANFHINIFSMFAEHESTVHFLQLCLNSSALSHAQLEVYWFMKASA